MSFRILKWLIFILSLSISLIACDEDRHNHSRLTSGKQLFEYHCARCHEKNGLGVFLKGVPASIATQKNESEIMLYLQGGPHTLNRQMPVFNNMSDKEARKIAQYLLQLRRTYFNDPKHRDKFLLERQTESLK